MKPSHSQSARRRLPEQRVFRGCGTAGRGSIASLTFSKKTRTRESPNCVTIVPVRLSGKMRPLTEEETKIFFEKLSKYIGDNIKSLIARDDGNYCFRLHRERVFYVSERIMKQVHSLTLVTYFFFYSKLKYKIILTRPRMWRERTCFLLELALASSPRRKSSGST